MHHENIPITHKYGQCICIDIVDYKEKHGICEVKRTKSDIKPSGKQHPSDEQL